MHDRCISLTSDSSMQLPNEVSSARKASTKSQSTRDSCCLSSARRDGSLSSVDAWRVASINSMFKDRYTQWKDRSELRKQQVTLAIRTLDTGERACSNRSRVLTSGRGLLASMLSACERIAKSLQSHCSGDSNVV